VKEITEKQKTFYKYAKNEGLLQLTLQKMFTIWSKKVKQLPLTFVENLLY